MKLRLCVLCVLASFVAGGRVEAIELLVNGGFETGNFAGWNVFDLGGGSWFIDNDGSTPLSGYNNVGPAAGLFFAVTDQPGPGVHVIEQPFLVPGPAQSVILSYDMFVNDSSIGPIVNPVGLNHDPNLGPNQHARVDIMSAAAVPFDTGPGVLANYYLGIDPHASNPNPYTTYSFDITALVGAGGVFKLRFAEVDNQGVFNQGIDNVSIQFTAVPEPSSILLAALALVALAVYGRRAKRR